MTPDDDNREPRRVRRREGLILLACGLALLAWALLAAPSWAAGPATGGAAEASSPVPEDCRQMVLVVADDWRAPAARLRLFARSGPRAPWKGADEAFPVALGKNGLAWGLGLHPSAQDGPAKREGDGKAPAGVFALGPAFARDPAELGARTGLPVLDLRQNLLCVDTPQSRFYNRIVPADQALPKDYDSAEDMLAVGDLYRFGLVVAHNDAPPKPGAGSCIFLHIWRAPGVPTAGCTAMAAGNLRDLLDRLDAKARPVLVQLPRDQYERLRGPWNLPRLEK